MNLKLEIVALLERAADEGLGEEAMTDHLAAACSSHVFVNHMEGLVKQRQRLIAVMDQALIYLCAFENVDVPPAELTTIVTAAES
jgi:hypothetical protein